MSDQPAWRAYPKRILEMPADLAIVAFLVGLTVFSVTAPTLRETSIGIGLGLALGLFLPGYAVVAALLPAIEREPFSETADPTTSPEASGSSGEQSLQTRGVTVVERLLLSVGLSVALLPSLALALIVTEGGLDPDSLVLVLHGVTFVGAAVAVGRRWRLPSERRFRVRFDRWLARSRSRQDATPLRREAPVLLLLLLGITLAVSGIAYGVTTPTQEEQFTTFSMLTETDSGELVAADYPTEFEEGEGKPVVLSVENHEHRETTYTVVVEIQRVSDEDGPVLEEDELDRFERTLQHGEVWRPTYLLEPTMTGERLRVAFLLYRGDVSESPTVENADEDLRLWVNVSASDVESSA
jgi:uncharacterized membrane protein